MPTSQEMKVDRTFSGAMEQVNKLQQVFRDGGLLSRTINDLKGDYDSDTIAKVFDDLYNELEEAHYAATAHLNVEEAKQKLGMAEEKYSDLPQQVELAGDSIWDRDAGNPNPDMVTVTDINVTEGDEGYVEVTVQHDGPWTVYTDTGFEKAISEMIDMEVSFSEQGMQEDGMAHLEGGDAMESVTEGACNCGSSCSCGGNCTPDCNCGPNCGDGSQADAELALLKRNAGI